MFTTRIDSTGPQDTVILLKNGKVIAEMTMTDFIQLSAVRYVVENEVASPGLLQAHLPADKLS